MASYELPIFYEMQNFMAVFQRTPLFPIISYKNAFHNFMGYICRIFPNVILSSTLFLNVPLHRFSG